MADSESEEPRRLSRGRLSRGKGLRKTTGCLTCRRRHIKCDEVKPKCGGCVRKGAACEYARRAPVTRSKSNAQVHVDAPATPLRDESQGNQGETEPQSNVSVNSILEDKEPQTTSNGTAEAPQHSSPMQTEPTQPVEEAALSPEAHQVFGSNAQLARDEPSFEETTVNGPFLDVNNTQVSGGFAEAPTSVATQGSHYAPLSRTRNRRYSQVRHVRYEGQSPGQMSSHSALFQFTGASDASQVVESPTARWLDLLIGDATLNHGALPDHETEPGGFDVFGNAMIYTPNQEVLHSGLGVENQAQSQPSSDVTKHPSLQERIPYQRYEQIVERQIWQTNGPIELQPQEHILFRHFIENLSQWMDLFEPKRTFGTYVPHLAIHNMGLMNAILALSARHIGIEGCEKPTYAQDLSLDPNEAVNYYYKTLQYSQKAMQYDTYKTSLELLAISLIISSYEMLDGSSKDWEKHLEGVFWIQRSQVIHGDSGGLRQAVWWAWLCQDVWAAFREKRKPFTFWRTAKTLEDLDAPEIAARSVYNFCQVVGYCSKREREDGHQNLAYRSLEADMLLQRLEDWKKWLTFEFEPLPCVASGSDRSEVFPPMWIQPAAYGVSMQLYYCSLILIYLDRPLGGGLDPYLKQQRQLKHCSKMICSIAVTQTDTASSIMSSQCVFIAGMTITDSKQRDAVLKLLEQSQYKSGWPGQSLGEELKQIWDRSDQAEG